MKISNHLFLYLRSRRSKNVGFRCFVCTKIPHHFFPLFTCLAGELKQNKTTNTTEMWQSLILFHHRGCKNWDCCILKNIKILRMKVSMMELWCYSSHWKCCLSMVMLGDTSTIFHFGHVKEGSWWPEFSKSRIRNEKRRKQEQLSPRQLNLHGKHPGGRRKGMELFFFSCLETHSDDLLAPQLLAWISSIILVLTCRWQPWSCSTKISIFPAQTTLGCFQG